MKNRCIPSMLDQVQDHLQEAKSFSNEVISQEKHLHQLQRSAGLLRESVCELGADDAAVQDIDDSVARCNTQLGSLKAFVAARCDSLQKLLLQSQSIQEAIDGLLVWLKDTEGALNNMRPASLNEEMLNDQMTQLDTVTVDINSHQPAVDSVKLSGSKVVKSSDADVAHEIKDKLSQLEGRFKAVLARASERDQDLSDVSDKLSRLQSRMKTFDDWMLPTLNSLESKDFWQLETQLYQDKVSDVDDSTDSTSVPG